MPSRRHDARASERPSVRGGSLVRGAFARQNNARLPSRVIIAKTTDGEGRKSGGQPKTWHRRLVEDLTVFRATKGPTEHFPLMFGVETAVWTVATEKTDKWYRGFLEAAAWFMVKWHKDEADLNRQRHASVVGGAQGNGRGGGRTR